MLNRTAEEITRQTSAYITDIMTRRGPSYSIPADKGGANSLGDELVAIFCQAVGIARLPDKKHKQWAKQLSSLAREWAASDAEAVEALKALLDAEGELNWKSYSSPFQSGFVDDFGLYLGRQGGSGERKQGWYEKFKEYIDS